MKQIDKFDEYTKLDNQLDELRYDINRDIEAVFIKYKDSFDCNLRWQEFEEFEIDGDCIELIFHVRYCGCCPAEIETLYISREFFSDFESAKLEKIENDKKIKAAKFAEEARLIAIKNEEKMAKEKAQLEKLKAKYEANIDDAPAGD